MIPTPYSVGDKSKAICHRCNKIVSTTFDHRDVPFDDGSGEEKGILAAVCDEAGGTVTLVEFG